jgi:hypothetical protein
MTTSYHLHTKQSVVVRGTFAFMKLVSQTEQEAPYIPKTPKFPLTLDCLLLNQLIHYRSRMTIHVAYKRNRRMDKYTSGERALIRRRITITVVTGTLFLIVGFAVCLHLFQKERRQPVSSSTIVDQSDGGGPILVDEEASNDEAPAYSGPTFLVEKPNIRPRARPSPGPATREPSGLPSAFPTKAPSLSPTKRPSWRPSTFPTVVPSLIPSYRPSFAEPSLLPTWGPSYVSYFPGNLTREQSKSNTVAFECRRIQVHSPHTSYMACCRRPTLIRRSRVTSTGSRRRTRPV